MQNTGYAKSKKNYVIVG